jgi:hypothetical protein
VQWQGGGGKLLLPFTVFLDSLRLEGMDLFLPHTVLSR